MIFFSEICAGEIRLLNGENQDGFTVIDQYGNDASDALLGSGSQFSPTLDLNNQAKIIFESTYQDGLEGLLSLSFVVEGGVTIAVELFGQDNFKYYWRLVSIFMC